MRRRSPSEARHYAPGHTTKAGLGTAHQAEARAQRKALAASPGQPCPYCRFPMYATVSAAAQVYGEFEVYRPRGRRVLGRQLWRVELDDVPARAICKRTGQTPVKRLAHAFCNRSAGGTLGNVIKAAARAASQPSRFDRW